MRDGCSRCDVGLRRCRPISRPANRRKRAVCGVTRCACSCRDRRHDSVVHARFRDLPRFLAPGDLLVVNTSGTLNAALPAVNATGTAVRDPSVHPTARRILDRRSATARTPGVVAVRRCTRRHDVRAAGRRPRHAARALSVRRRLDARRACGSPRSSFRSVDAVPRAYGFPIRYGYVTALVAQLDVSDGVRD